MTMTVIMVTIIMLTLDYDSHYGHHNYVDSCVQVCRTTEQTQAQAKMG